MPYFQIFLLLTCVWIIGRIFHKIRLPAIFGEILAGIILGPVVLGIVHTNEAISVLAELGIFFLMLHAGLETSPQDLFKASKRSFVVAFFGAMIPFFGGFYISHLFGYSLNQALFIGLGLSISSIAVSAKLFKDYNIQDSRVAHTTLGAAVIDDVIGLLLLTIILSISQSGTIEFWAVAFLILKLCAFFFFILLVGAKAFKKLHRILYLGNKGFTFTIIIALAFGLIAELLGLHIIIGAFFAGLFIREETIDPKLYKKIEDRIFGVSYSLFGPIFFASLAFHLDFSALKSETFFTLIILIFAVFSKVFGAGIASYLTKLSIPESLAIGFSMNSRGAVELVIAKIAFEKGIIDAKIVSLLVVVSFFTTIVSIIGLKPLSKYL